MCKRSFGKALAAATITISSPSAQIILSGGWWKGKITFKSFFQLGFVWFLLWMQKVPRMILSPLVGVLWPSHHLVLQTVVWWEKRLAVHPKIVQKKITKTTQGLLFNGVTDANNYEGQVSADVKISKSPCWTSCPWQCPEPFLQWWLVWWPCSEVHLGAQANWIRQIPK